MNVPIAVVGTAGRFPGAASTRELWRLLLRESCPTDVVPSSRFDIDRFYDPDARSPGAIGSRYGGFLDGIDRFDAGFFSLSRREARVMDPQQRLLLEVAWEAFEDAGLRAGADTGVYLGMIANEYAERLPADNVDLSALTGAGSRNAAAGRLSRFFGASGPNMVIDTDRSSSLVAVEQASRALARGECSVALAGGSNLILSPRTSMAFSNAGSLAPDGRCKFGDAAADGFVRSEAVGLVVLKPFQAALADGDSIHAVLLGGAVNSNGSASSDLMRPSVESQVEVLGSACRDANVAPEEVGYVEAHGTGTPAGDPAELTALGRAYRAQGGDRLRIGSIKTNIGHTEAAAGVCGLVKTVWALREGVLPPSLHFRTPREDVDFDELGLRVVTECEAWPEPDTPNGATGSRGSGRLAGVSSFGLTGTNAHAVLASAAEAKRRFPEFLPPEPEPDAAETTARAQVVTISAHSRAALTAHVRAHRDRVSAWDETTHGSLSQLAHTTGARRMHREQRLAAVVRSTDELADELNAYLDGEPSGNIATGIAESKRRVVFVCAGQGSQWLGMGRELLEREPVFADAIRRIDAAARPYSWSPLAELSSGGDSVEAGAHDVQPALFAMTVGLAELWRSRGVEPDAYVGNSMGEVAAAYLAGALTLEDAVRVIWERSRLTASISGTAGEVMSVELPAEALTPWLEPYEQRVVVGVYSSPHASVLSGDSAALAELAQRFEANGITCRTVPFRAPIASHSPLMEPLREPMLDALRSVRTHGCTTPFLSTVDVEYVTEPFGADYWWRNLREPVRFEPAVRRLLAEGHDTFVELSPHPTLRRPVEDTAYEAGATAKVVSSLRRERPERETLLANLAELHVWGVPVDWAKLHGKPESPVALPSYPWQRQSYWLDPATPEADGAAGHPETTVTSATVGTDSSEDQVASSTANEHDDRVPSFRSRLESAEQRERISLLESFLRREIARVLDEEAAEDVPLDVPFHELGVTSVLGLDLCTGLERALEHRVPPPVLYRTGTVRALTSWFREELELGTASGATGADSAVDPNAASREETTESTAHSPDEPIAVVSTACRFPGGVVDPDGFWELLRAGGDAITDVPASRFDIDAVFDPDPEAEGSTYSRSGGFLDGIDEFDPMFFGIPPHEAKSVDPQQRLLLETTWEALERAGLRAEELKGSRTGVFVGLWTEEYQNEALRDTDGIDAYTLLGTNPSATAGRISYWLGLRGPNLPVNTACSSSLVAMHLACQSLRSGECEQALVGGVNVLLSAAGFVYFSRVGALSPTGRCQAFSADADGYVRSEGCGMVLLKRLSDAERDGDHVLAVVRGSAVNQDGRSNGFTAPNGAAQREMLSQALDRADIAGNTVDAVECHGTGTPLGDPTEVQALAEVYGRDRPADRPLLLGSVKSNIGHTEAAAGIAGLLKAVLSLQRETLPPSLHVERLNPHLAWDESPVHVATEPTPLPPGTRPRRIGVSSFGISGTNAHVIVEEAPEGSSVAKSGEGESSSVLLSPPLVISGHTESALWANAARLAEFVGSVAGEGCAEGFLSGVAAGLVTRRTAFGERVAVPVSEPAGAVERLRLVAGGSLPQGAVRASASCGRVVWVFPGQGGQFPGMCRSLLGDEVFRAALVECDGALRPYTGFSVVELLEADEESQREQLERVTVVQPVLFAVGVALSRVWGCWGVSPDAVVGHSQGEVAAAVAAGVLSVAEGARVVGVRSRLVAGLAGDGGMGSVALPVARVRRRLAEWGGALSVAVVNTAESTVVAGDRQELEEFLAVLEGEGVSCRRIKVDYASHSPQVDPVLGEIRSELADLAPTTGDVPVVSTVRGARVDGSELDANYWADNLREPVRLDLALEALAPGEDTVFLELGAHPLLVGPLGGAGHVAVGSLHRDEDGASRLRQAAAELFTHGIPVDWDTVYAGTNTQTVDLPTYAFQRQHYWLRPTEVASAEPARLGLDGGEHPLLPARTDLSDGSVLFTGSLDRTAQWWLDDHRIFDTVLVPGTALVEMALHASRAVGLTGVGEALLAAPLPLAVDEFRRVQLLVAEPDDEGKRAFTIHSRAESDGNEATWVRHVTGTLAAHELPEPTPLATWPPEDAVPADLTGLYERLAARGYDYGPAFRGATKAWHLGTTTFVEVTSPPEITRDPEGPRAAEFGVHPALLDATLHCVLETAAGEEALVLPFEWRRVALHAVGATALRARIERDGRELRIDAFDLAGQPLATIEALVTRPATETQLSTASDTDARQLYRLRAVPLHETEPADISRRRFVDGWTADVESVLADLESEQATTGKSDTAPRPLLVVDWSGSETGLEATRETTLRGLEWLRRWYSSDRAASVRLVWLTRGALSCRVSEPPVNPAAAALWGLGRTARLEHPDRDLVLLDVDDTAEPALTDLLARIPADEPQLAARRGELNRLRLESEARTHELEEPTADEWRLDIGERGDLSTLRLTPHPEAAEKLPPGCVRIAVRAGGINFRDVLTAMGMYPGEAEPLGFEGAGVVTEAAEDVADLVPGDRVVGFFASAFASLAVADARKVRPIPDAVSFAEAATVPVVFLTASYALDHLAGVMNGERLLLHSAAGGVGQAAIQLARLRGVEVFATAGPAKWDELRALGLPDDHIASSRDTDFETAFTRATGGEGVDVVLNSLTDEKIDASLRLLSPGGRFIEMGKTDVREAETLRESHPGVSYRAFDLLAEVEPARLGEMLDEVLADMARERLRPLPYRAVDLRGARDVFRVMAQGGHTGKLVFQPPRRPLRREIDTAGTVLITGGTGGLAGALAEHLVTVHGVRHLLLLSRSGNAASGTDDRVAELLAAGAETVRVEACDVADRQALAAVLDAVPAAHPLTAVVHAAGVLDDGMLAELSPERVGNVFGPKVDAAWHLHELTRELDLSAFVLFSSVIGTVGNASQGAYAAANAALDALAARRRAMGLAATSIAWGTWADAGMVTRLDTALQRRLRRGGLVPLRSEQGLRLFDRVLDADRTNEVAVRVDQRALQRTADEDLSAVPPVLRGFVRSSARRAADAAATTDGPVRRLAELDTPEARHEALLEIVRSEIATVMGLPTARSVPVGGGQNAPSLRELGVDSLMAVEIRNRLSKLVGESLPTTLLFDQPTVDALARYLADKLGEPVQRSATASSTTTEREAPLDEPIAIVSMACRFPGEVDGPEQLWRLLADGEDGITAFPERPGWEIDGLYSPDPDEPGRSVTREGGFLHDAGRFDASFFGISPREAQRIDPQQRLLLEVSWEALERTGIVPASLEGSSSGVYFGLMYNDYGGRLLDHRESLDGYVTVGSLQSAASGRLAYTLGLRGPAVSVDTACSSSLVGIHQAMQGLRRGECDLAFAGGVTVMTTPSMFIEFSRQRGLAPDGRCKPFSELADGAGWSEGCGVLLLERLSDARSNGHEVLAVLRSGAVNQDGRSQGLTAPNGPAQERVIGAALRAGGLAPDEVDAVEAHGTGTTLGDPIEANALLASYGDGHDSETPLYVGSVKSNLGHPQAAAGVAGVIKMVQALRHEELPRSLYAESPSSHVDWSSGQVRLLDEAVSWPRREGHVRRAGVSSFGISGTNAHVILEEAPAIEGFEHEGDVRSSSGAASFPLVLSGHTESALWANAARLAEWLREASEGDGRLPELRDVAAGLVTRRTAFGERVAVPVSEPAGAVERLRLVAGGSLPQGAVRAAASCGRVVWVFPGQGGQFPGMCRSLLGDEVFRAALVECDGALRPYTGFSVVELLEADEESQREQLERVTVVQPVLFAVGVALSRVWGCWGVSPDAVVGHSQGEVAAAVAAGVLSVAEGARVVGVRSRLVAGLAGDGGMGSVSLPVGQVRRRLAEWGGALSVAVVNTAESTVVAGDRQELEEFLAVLEGEGVSCRRIKVDYASHSPQVDPVLGEIRSELADLAPTTGDVPVVSTVRGARVDGSELDGDYWADNLRQPVRLDLALEDLAPGEDTVFLELGAHPLLVGPLGGAGHVAVGSLHRDEDGASRLRQAAAELFAHGIPIDWDTVYAGTNTQTVDLPTYAFQHQHYWLDVTPSAPNGASNGTGVVEEPLWEAVRAHEVDTVADMLEIPEQRHEDLAALLPHLARWRTRRAAGAELANWLYEEQWISVPSHGDVIRPSGTWLLLSEQPGAQRAESIAAAVEAAGAEVLRLELADDPDEAATRLASAAADTPLSGVLLVAGAESDAPSEPSLESDPQLTSRLTRWVVRLRSIVRTLREVSGDAPLWLLTTGAVGTASETPEGELHDPSRSALWGLGRVVGLEHPDLLGGLVDLPAGPLDRSTTDALITAITADDAEDQLALRPDRDGSAQRLVRRVVRARPEVEVADSGFALAGTVLVTGGTGGLGARTARWLAECAREQLHLVLTSRSGAAAPGAAALREELESLGARVTLASCDVAERTELERLLSGLDEPVRAVFHAAGATEPRPLASHDAVYVERELSAKVAGAANLHALLDPEPLEAFVLYGSLAGFWGSGEQGAYAAANAFLDGLTRRRRARGVPATIVHWGSWGEGGMVSAETDAQLRRRGIPPMAPEVAIRGLELALRDGRPALAVADVEWSSFTASYAAGRPRPLLHGVDEARRALEGETHQDEDHDRAATRLGERLRAVPVDKREETVLEAVRAEIAAVFGMSEAAAVPSDRPLRDSGLDSMMAVQMRNRLAVLCGTKLPPSLLFDYPTPEDLAAYLTHLLRDEVDDLTGLESVLERLEHLPDETLRQPRFSRRIAALTRRLESHETTAEPRSDSEIRTSVADVSDDDLLTFIDQEIEDL